MTKEHMKRPDKSRQNWEETRRKRIEKSKRIHPNVDHTEAQWAEEVTMSRSGKKYRKPVMVFGKFEPKEKK